MNRVAAAFMALVIVAPAFVGGWYIGQVTRDKGTQVSCPEEDSCSIDYRNGGWYIDGQRVTR